MRRLPGLVVVAARIGGCWIGIFRAFVIIPATSSMDYADSRDVGAYDESRAAYHLDHADSVVLSRARANSESGL